MDNYYLEVPRALTKVCDGRIQVDQVSADFLQEEVDSLMSGGGT